MKYIIVLFFSAIGSLIVFFKICLFKKLTGKYLVLTGVSVSKWQRCRKFKDLELIAFYPPSHAIKINNADFHFKCENVKITTRKQQY